MSAAGLELAVSASRPDLLCALREGDGSVHAAPTDAAGLRGAGVPVGVDALLRARGHRLTDVARLRVDLGPGSYTGLRVAVTFARFAARFAGVALSTFTGPELLAATAWSAGCATDRVRVVLDARRGRAHTALLTRSTAGVEVAEAPRALALRELSDLATGDSVAPTTWLLDPTLEAAAALLESLERAGTPRQAMPRPDATDLFTAVLRPRAARLEDVQPLYLMGTYADTPHAG
jgi:tRNA threonylcarbamoyl adenosine modification protein YeaZ